jgi:hypothetical protein
VCVTHDFAANFLPLLRSKKKEQGGSRANQKGKPLFALAKQQGGGMAHCLVRSIILACVAVLYLSARKMFFFQSSPRPVRRATPSSLYVF